MSCGPEGKGLPGDKDGSRKNSDRVESTRES